MKIVFLTPRSSFRNQLKSDSLFGLLIWGIEKIHGEEVVAEIINDCINNQPPFLLSSAFPFKLENGKRVLYFPKPVNKPPQLEIEKHTISRYKDYKNVKWLPDAIFYRFVRGELSEVEFFNNNLWENIKNPWGNTQQVMHNTIDRISNASTRLFYTLEHFIENGGLYFLIDERKEGIERMLRGVFQFYEHSGFGGDASTGKGAFNFMTETFQQPLSNSDGDCKLNLSLYYPGEDEVKHFANNPEKVWYRMELRKGKVGGRLHIQPDVWKKGINVFSEGSIFPAIPEKTVYGAFPVVKEHKKNQRFDVFYNGFALMVNYKLKGQ